MPVEKYDFTDVLSDWEFTKKFACQMFKMCIEIEVCLFFVWLPDVDLGTEQLVLSSPA